jgi:hypothetical protein
LKESQKLHLSRAGVVEFLKTGWQLISQGEFWGVFLLFLVRSTEK